MNGWMEKSIFELDQDVVLDAEELWNTDLRSEFKKSERKPELEEETLESHDSLGILHDCDAHRLSGSQNFWKLNWKISRFCQTKWLPRFL